MLRTASAVTVGTHWKQVDFWAILLPPAAPSSPCNAPSTRYPLNTSSTRQPGECGHIPPCSMCACRTNCCSSIYATLNGAEGWGWREVCAPESLRLGKVFTQLRQYPTLLLAAHSHPLPGAL